jgi:hypothetical protein
MLGPTPLKAELVRATAGTTPRPAPPMPATAGMTPATVGSVAGMAASMVVAAGSVAVTVGSTAVPTSDDAALPRLGQHRRRAPVPLRLTPVRLALAVADLLESAIPGARRVVVHGGTHAFAEDEYRWFVRSRRMRPSSRSHR